MHTVVKFTVDPMGDPTPKEDQVWHLMREYDGAPRAFCSGEVYGEGESRAEYKEKDVKVGGISCPKCMEMIKGIKSIRL